MKENFFKLKIIDNFLNNSYHTEIFNTLNGFNFPWYYQSDLTHYNKKNSINDFGFNHYFIDDNGPRFTNYYYLILPLLLKIKDTLNAKKILRSRADMTMYSPLGYIHKYHVDYKINNIATVYYVNNSDGATIIKNTKEKIYPKANRLAIFDGSILHTGSSPKKNKNRILINSNFII
jgi:hypothetical protein